MYLQTRTDTLDDPAKGRTPTNRVGIIIYGAQRVDQQDATANKVTGFLDLPGDLAAVRQASSTTADT